MAILVDREGRAGGHRGVGRQVSNRLPIDGLPPYLCRSPKVTEVLPLLNRRGSHADNDQAAQPIGLVPDAKVEAVGLTLGPIQRDDGLNARKLA